MAPRWHAAVHHPAAARCLGSRRGVSGGKGRPAAGASPACSGRPLPRPPSPRLLPAPWCAAADLKDMQQTLDEGDFSSYMQVGRRDGWAGRPALARAWRHLASWYLLPHDPVCGGGPLPGPRPSPPPCCLPRVCAPQDLNFRHYLMKLKVTNEVYNDETKLRTSAVSVMAPNFTQEGKALLDMIGKMERGEPVFAPRPPPQQQQQQYGGGGYGGGGAYGGGGGGGYGGPPPQQPGYGGFKQQTPLRQGGNQNQVGRSAPLNQALTCMPAVR